MYCLSKTCPPCPQENDSMLTDVLGYTHVRLHDVGDWQSIYIEHPVSVPRLNPPRSVSWSKRGL